MTGNKYEISVLIATYKTPVTLLERAVNSALNAGGDGLSVEVVVVQDGWNWKLVFPYEVTVINHKENMGPAAAFNTALDAAQGEYCIILADDDFLAPGYPLHRLYAAAREHDGDTFAYGDVKLPIGAVHQNPAWSKHQAGERLKTSYAVLFPRKYASMGARFHQPDAIPVYVYDRDFVLQLEQLGCKGTHVPGVVLHYTNDRRKLGRHGDKLENYRAEIEAYITERFFSEKPKAASRRMRVESPAPPVEAVTDVTDETIITPTYPEPNEEIVGYYEKIDEGDDFEG